MVASVGCHSHDWLEKNKLFISRGNWQPVVPRADKIMSFLNNEHCCREHLVSSFLFFLFFFVFFFVSSPTFPQLKELSFFYKQHDRREGADTCLFTRSTNSATKETIDERLLANDGQSTSKGALYKPSSSRYCHSHFVVQSTL